MITHKESTLYDHSQENKANKSLNKLIGTILVRKLR